MIKLPKEINKIIKTIENAGFEAFVVGGGVRDSLLGEHPVDWDIACSASVEKMKELFPEAMAVGPQYGVIRMNEGDFTVEAATYRTESGYSDFRRPDQVVFTDNIGEDLKRRDFTINAIAINPQRGVVDPFHGRADLKGRVIRAIGDPMRRFEEDPVRILRGIRFAAQLDFDVEENTLEAMKKQVRLLEKVNINLIRQEFIKLITAKNSSRGLFLCLSTDAINPILGEPCMNGLNKFETTALSQLAENIDRSRIEDEFRLGLVFLCFEKERALQAIERLQFDHHMNRLLAAAQNHLEDLSFVNTRILLKRFIYKVGEDIYNYLENLAKQQRKVYDLNEYKIRNRLTIYKDIKKFNEPIFIRDLAINGDDLKKIGMVEGQEIGIMLDMLMDVVHKHPALNNPEALLKKANQFRKNPVSVLLRKVVWFK